MEIQCRKRDLSTYDVFEIYENRLQSETTMAAATMQYLSDSGYATWSEWHLCTVKCGSGSKQRSRIHFNGTEETEESACNTTPCGEFYSGIREVSYILSMRVIFTKMRIHCGTCFGQFVFRRKIVFRIRRFVRSNKFQFGSCEIISYK